MKKSEPKTLLGWKRKANAWRLDYEAAVDEISKCRKQLQAERDRAEANADAAIAICEQAKIKPEYAAQLGLASVVKNDAGEAIGFKKRTVQDALNDDNARAGEVKFRQLKTHFINYQLGVEDLGKVLKSKLGKNTLSTEDLQDIRDLSEGLEAVLNRKFI